MNRPDDRPSAPASSASSSSAIMRRELGRARRPRLHAHHHQPQRVVPDQHAGIDGGRRKRVEIVGKRRLAERQPRRARAQIVAQQLDLAGQHRRDRKSAMADDLGGHALADLAFGLGIDRQGEVGMGLDVDEARRDREPCGVDGPAGIGRDLRPDGGNAAVRDREIARNAGAAAAVEQEPVADQEVAAHARASCFTRRCADNGHSTIRRGVNRIGLAVESRSSRLQSCSYRHRPVDRRTASGNRQTGRGRQSLKEKELRIALVCFGGVSLAVYMHGITKEVLKLVRASSVLHAHRGSRRALARVLLRQGRPQRSRI